MNLKLLNSKDHAVSIFPTWWRYQSTKPLKAEMTVSFVINRKFRKLTGDFWKLRNYPIWFSQSRKRDRNETDFKKYRKSNGLKRSKSELVKIDFICNVPISFLQQYFLRSFVHIPRWFHYSQHLLIPPAHLQDCTDTNTLVPDRNKTHWVTDTHPLRWILL